MASIPFPLPARLLSTAFFLSPTPHPGNAFLTLPLTRRSSYSSDRLLKSPPYKLHSPLLPVPSLSPKFFICRKLLEKTSSFKRPLFFFVIGQKVDPSAIVEDFSSLSPFTLTPCLPPHYQLPRAVILQFRFALKAPPNG